jgi:hypothetical protein
MLEILERKGNRLDKMLFQLKWPPPGHLSAILLDKISLSFEKGKITAQDVDEILVHFYNKDRLQEIVDTWSEQKFIQPRMKILREVVTAHIEGRYELSIPSLLPQIEGIIADINKHAGRMNFPNIKEYVEAMFARDTRFDRVGKTFFLSILYENFEWQDPIPFLSRNAILHGADTNYASASNSLRLILMFDLLQDSTKVYY